MQWHFFDEPSTMMTDYLLAVQCLYFFLYLSRHRHDSFSHYMKLAFLAIGLAALTGGTVHGFRPVLADGVETALWLMTLYATGVAAFLLSVACFRLSLPKLAHSAIWGVFGLKLVAFLIWISGQPEFIWVIMDYGSAMLAILCLSIYTHLRHRLGHERLFIAAILIAFAGAAVQASGFSLHTHFNNNDIFHLIKLVSFYLFFKGVLTLQPASR